MFIFSLISPDFATCSLALHKHLVSVVVKRLSTCASLALNTLATMFFIHRMQETLLRQKTGLPHGFYYWKTLRWLFLNLNDFVLFSFSYWSINNNRVASGLFLIILKLAHNWTLMANSSLWYKNELTWGCKDQGVGLIATVRVNLRLQPYLKF